LEIIEFFQSALTKHSKLPWADGIDTKSNLRSDVFHEIVLTLGLDYSRFSTKEKLLDEKLVNNRNRIAHGQFSLVDFGEYLKLHDELLAMMQDFYNQVDNSAITGAYRAP
jgi:hypothetical protein